MNDFEQIVREHQSMVFRTLARLIGRDDALDDLAQDVFLRLYRALPSFRGDAAISTYLYRITVNVAQDEWKRRRRPQFDPRLHVSLSEPSSGDGPLWESRLEHPCSTAAELMQEAEFALAVDEHLNNLSHLERSVLVLYHQEDQTYEQIAGTLGLPINTVRTHLHRGRNKMRDALQPRRDGRPEPAAPQKGLLHAR